MLIKSKLQVPLSTIIFFSANNNANATSSHSSSATAKVATTLFYNIFLHASSVVHVLINFC